MAEKGELEICKLCNGTGNSSFGGKSKCRRCKGMGKESFKFHKRPLTCYFCLNTGICDKCKGYKFQKKYLFFGSNIKCKKCNGTGICPVCKDAPNGGYYIVWYIDYFAHSFVPHYGRLIKETNKKIKEQKNKFEKLKVNNKKIVSFEDYAKYPPFNDIRNGMGITDFSWSELCYNVNNEIKRYELYLTKFE